MLPEHEGLDSSPNWDTYLRCSMINLLLSLTAVPMGMPYSFNCGLENRAYRLPWAPSELYLWKKECMNMTIKYIEGILRHNCSGVGVGDHVTITIWSALSSGFLFSVVTCAKQVTQLMIKGSSCHTFVRCETESPGSIGSQISRSTGRLLVKFGK